MNCGSVKSSFFLGAGCRATGRVDLHVRPNYVPAPCHLGRAKPAGIRDVQEPDERLRMDAGGGVDDGRQPCTSPIDEDLAMGELLGRPDPGIAGDRMGQSMPCFVARSHLPVCGGARNAPTFIYGTANDGRRADSRGSHSSRVGTLALRRALQSADVEKESTVDDSWAQSALDPAGGSANSFHRRLPNRHARL